MQNYSIMPLDTEHIDEVCQDVAEQLETGVSNCPLFMFKLVPEGDPPFDKAGALAEKYILFRDRLAAEGYECGILAQCTMGHGYPLDTPFSFQPLVHLNDGKTETVCCPYDKGFQKYLRKSFATVAACRPKSIMVDDDFRLFFRPGMGCACPTHMAEFNKRAGTDLDRQALFDRIKAPKTEEDRRYKEIYIRTQYDSLIESAHAIRAGIDDVDPTIPGTYCSCPIGNSGDIARVLAGAGNPPTVRINNGQYTTPGARGLSDAVRRAASQMALQINQGLVFLAETDTCPQNRYSTGAQSLHAHFTASILEGVSGAKHWITRLAAFEPNSGKAYRKILQKNRGFYEYLSDICKDIAWQGCRLPLAKAFEIDLGAANAFSEAHISGWPTCVLERLGLPMYFSAKDGGAVFLDNGGDAVFTDEEIESWFRGSVFLAAGAADSLNQRGFGKYIGVKVGDPPALRASGEIICANGNVCNAQQRVRELIPDAPGVKAASHVYHLENGSEKHLLFPGVAVYPRQEGITVTFSGTPTAQFHYTEAFSFLNESRKLQLVQLLKECGNLPVYYPEDAEMMLKAGTMPDGTRFCAVFNLGLDPLEELPLVFEQMPQAMEMLLPNGTRAAVPFRTENGVTTVAAEVRTLDPVILFVK